MITLALPLAAAAALLPEVRAFWAVETGPHPQPAQVEVHARLVREGLAVAVYQEEGYRFSSLGPEDETRQIENAVNVFDTAIYPREVALFGPCPDRDHNGKVILLVTRTAPVAGLFFPFDEMAEPEALRYGFHSNEGEVLFQTFDSQGNRAERNIQELAETFHRLLHYSRNPGETSWSRLLAHYSPYMCGLASARLLWGDADPEGRAHPPAEPWDSRGWPLLFVEYLRDKLGAESLRDLALQPEGGLASVGRLLAGRGDQRTASDLLADFAMACWLDDPAVAGGRFAFSSVVPPRPLPAARATASRPTSGAVDVGVGGMAFIVVDGNGERPFPLTLQGDASVGWVARAVRLRVLGPDTELPIAFAPSGVAKLDLPMLAPGESVVVAAVAVPGDSPLFDRRSLLLRWGIGWVPHAPADQGREALAELVKKALPDGGAAARTRLLHQFGERLAALVGGRMGHPGRPQRRSRLRRSKRGESPGTATAGPTTLSPGASIGRSSLATPEGANAIGNSVSGPRARSLTARATQPTDIALQRQRERALAAVHDDERHPSTPTSTAPDVGRDAVALARERPGRHRAQREARRQRRGSRASTPSRSRRGDQNDVGRRGRPATGRRSPGRLRAATRGREGSPRRACPAGTRRRAAASRASPGLGGRVGAPLRVGVPPQQARRGEPAHIRRVVASRRFHEVSPGLRL